jgi:hypothetical protein
VPLVRGVVHGAPKGIQQAAIDGDTLLDAALEIEMLSVFSLQVRDLPDPELPKILSDALANTWNFLQLFQCLSFHLNCHRNALFMSEENFQTLELSLIFPSALCSA